MSEAVDLADLLAGVGDAVPRLRRRTDETYGELIERAAEDELGRLVKLADNCWNVLSMPGLAALDPKRAERMLHDRYLPARARLLDGLEDGEETLASMTSALRPFLPQSPTDVALAELDDRGGP